MMQPTYLVHPEQLTDAERRADWQAFARDVRVFVLPVVSAVLVPLETWIQRQQLGTAG